jgi:hypothetical protein
LADDLSRGLYDSPSMTTSSAPLLKQSILPGRRWNPVRRELR